MVSSRWKKCTREVGINSFLARFGSFGKRLLVPPGDRGCGSARGLASHLCASPPAAGPPFPLALLFGCFSLFSLHFASSSLPPFPFISSFSSLSWSSSLAQNLVRHHFPGCPPNLGSFGLAARLGTVVAPLPSQPGLRELAPESC